MLKWVQKYLVRRFVEPGGIRKISNLSGSYVPVEVGSYLVTGTPEDIYFPDGLFNMAFSFNGNTPLNPDQRTYNHHTAYRDSDLASPSPIGYQVDTASSLHPNLFGLFTRSEDVMQVYCTGIDFTNGGPFTFYAFYRTVVPRYVSMPYGSGTLYKFE